MFRSIKKRDEILSMTNGHIIKISDRIEMTIKEFIASMVHAPVDELSLSESVILSVKDYIASGKTMVNIGDFDGDGFFTLSLNREDVAVMVRRAMGYKEKKEGDLSKMEATVFSQYLLPYIEKFSDLFRIPILGNKGMIELSKFNYADGDYGMMRRYIAQTEAGELRFNIFISQSLLRRSVAEDGTMDAAADSILVDLVAEMYIKEMPLGDILKYQPGDRIDLPSPDSIELREKLTHSRVLTGELGVVSDLKSLKVLEIN